MTLRDRIGFDAGSRRLEDALAWASQHGFHHVDFNADLAANHLVTGWDDARVRAVRQTCERHDIHLGLHTSSAVNVAEFSPYVAEGVETYLRANVDLAGRLGCEWLVVHAGWPHALTNDEDDDRREGRRGDHRSPLNPFDGPTVNVGARRPLVLWVWLCMNGG